MQQIQEFQYVTVLYIKMGYYNIIISPTSQDMTTIVTEFRKFRYNCLPMVMCDSGDILHTQVYKIFGDIEGVKTYMDKILVLSNERFDNNIEKPRTIFGGLRASGLKFNDPKCSFRLKETTYLGYVITR